MNSPKLKIIEPENNKYLRLVGKPSFRRTRNASGINLVTQCLANYQSSLNCELQTSCVFSLEIIQSIIVPDSEGREKTVKITSPTTVLGSFAEVEAPKDACF